MSRSPNQPPNRSSNMERLSPLPRLRERNQLGHRAPLLARARSNFLSRSPANLRNPTVAATSPPASTLSEPALPAAKGAVISPGRKRLLRNSMPSRDGGTKSISAPKGRDVKARHGSAGKPEVGRTESASADGRSKSGVGKINGTESRKGRHRRVLRGAALHPRKPETDNWKCNLETRNSELETRNSKLETRNPKPETRNSKLETAFMNTP
jgi:hypothetical protein